MGLWLRGAFLSVWLWPAAVLADGCQGEANAYGRLACHERLSWTMGKSAACMRLNGDHARLTCFDQSDRGAPPEATRSTPVSTAPTAAASATSSTPTRYRVEGGWGYGIGNYDGTIGKMSRNLSIDSLLGVRGSVAHLGVWDDRLISSKVSIGVEYIRLKAHSEVNGVAGEGISFVHERLDLKAVADVSANLGYLNLVYRPRQDDTLRPFVGGGLGVGRARLHTSYSIGEVISDDADQTQSSWVAGLQALGGVEVDVGAGFHLTPALRVLYFTSKPLGMPHQFVDVNLELGLGYRF
ncbi:MAG: hypothetical protein H7Y60_04455 [Rhodospirillaceae bacterium]|nr:hypothetical protein [Rhodospirillales bacterium]